MPLEKQFNEKVTLERVVQAFWVRGYEATSMQNLVDRTGVNRASLYATYGDKRALFLSALRSYDMGRKQMLAGLEARHRPREAIREVFLAFTRNISERGGNRGCFLTNTALELAAHDAEIRRIVSNAQEDVEGFFARMIIKGKAAGDIQAHIMPGEAARGLLASLLGLLVLTRSRPDRQLLKTIVEDAMQRLD